MSANSNKTPSLVNGFFKGPTEPLDPPRGVNQNRHGCMGTSTKIITNYLSFSQRLKKIYQYAVTFESSTLGKDRKRFLLDTLRQHGLHNIKVSATGSGSVATGNAGTDNTTTGNANSGDAGSGNADSDKTAISTTANDQTSDNKQPVADILWVNDLQNIWSVARLHAADNFSIGQETITVNGRSIEVPRITFRLCWDLPIGDEADCIRNSGHEADILRALNAFISTPISQSRTTVVQIGSNKFYERDSREYIGEPLIASRGYFLSTRLGEKRILVNINPATSAFFNSDMLHNCISNLERKMGLRGTSLEQVLRGKRVWITYERKHYNKERSDPNYPENRTKRIANIGKQPDTQTYQEHDTEDTPTVLSYYQREHGNLVDNYDLTRSENLCANLGRPIDRCGPQHARWYPSELLKLLPHQLFTGTLTSEQVSKMIKVACQDAGLNAARIYDIGMMLLGFRDQAPIFNQFRVTVGQKLARIDGRILGSPQIRYRGTPVNPKNASWNLKDTEFVQPSKVAGFQVLIVNNAPQNTRLRPHHADLIEKRMIEAFETHGMGHTLKPNTAVTATITNRKELKSKLEDYVELGGGRKKKYLADNDSSILVVLPSDSIDVYAAVKRAADCKFGTRTVACVSTKVLRAADKHNRQHFSNLALKFNFKTGGVNHGIDKSPLMNKLFSGRNPDKIDTLILGADVTHPGPGSSAGCPSIAAVVGSVNKDFSNMRGSMRLQASRQEKIEDMEGMAFERLKAFKSTSGDLPTNVLMFRDGVSESQFKEIRDNEVEAIRRAYKRAHGDTSKLRVSFYVVTKRHHTRFYPQDAANAHRGNVRPGLVVDRVITRPQISNFFLQSHDAIQGTARPAHYIEIANEMRLTADEIQHIAHILCYTYARATKGVSYCAPAYYADRLCERGRMYMRDYLIGLASCRKKETGEALDVYRTDVANKIMEDKDGPWKRWWLDGRIPDEDKRIRANPWHPNLDRVMFWM